MPSLDSQSLDLHFRKARTNSKWLGQSVSDQTLRDLYDLMKFGPASMNCAPARILFLRAREAKERLKPALTAGNVEKTMIAPVTAIVAYDEKFYDKLDRLFSPLCRRARDLR